MKLKIEQPKLQKLLGQVIGAVAKRNVVPILSNVKLATDHGYIVATTTDLDMEITARVECDVEKDGVATVDAQTLAGIVGKLPKGDLISLDYYGQHVHVAAGRSKFKLVTLPVEDFPVFAMDQYNAEMTFDGAALKEYIDRAIWAVSTEETRYYLNGIAIQHRDNKVNMIATDGHRFAWYTGQDVGNDFPDVILPTHAARQFAQACDDGPADLSLSSTKARLVSGNVTIVTKVIDGTFPDWTRVIPSGYTDSVVMQSVAAKQAIDRVSVMASDKTRAVKLEIADGTVNFSVVDQNGGNAQETIDVAQSGKDVIIGLNGKYALDAFAQADKGDVTIGYAEPSSPLTVRYENCPGLLAVVMPMRVN